MSWWWPYWFKRRRTAQVTGSAVLKRQAVARTASLTGSAWLRLQAVARSSSVAGSAALSAPHPPPSSRGVNLLFWRTAPRQTPAPGSRGVNLLFWRTAKD